MPGGTCGGERACQSQAVCSAADWPLRRLTASSSLVSHPSLAGESPTPRVNSARCLPPSATHRKSRLLPPSLQPQPYHGLLLPSPLGAPVSRLIVRRRLAIRPVPLLPATADGDPSAPSLPPPLQEDRSSSSPFKLYLLLPPSLELMQICAIAVWSRRCGVEDIDRNCGLHT